MRQAEIERVTRETQIKLSLNLDGGNYQIDTGCGFLNHMLELFAAHGGFGLQISARGDTEVDYHHTVEDVGIVLGQALRQALGDMRGVARYGQQLLPMDEALLLAVVDISGRAYLVYDVTLPTARVGDFDTELAEEFMQALVRNAGLTLHCRMLAGHNSHHIIEALFKAVARALRQAVQLDARQADKIPSTKGVI
ncbi:MAG: imidazoleglycerol-phosphate dehydratase HisB [Firmicutes bacterium]|nr:imidazoleglycerol-phosphate dehydratase HisB [Bacillota bacterium]